MNVITCPVCEKRYLVGKSSMLWFANTDVGPRALVECPKGHQLIEDYREGTTTVATGPVAFASS
jgi:hypothetical protein